MANFHSLLKYGIINSVQHKVFSILLEIIYGLSTVCSSVCSFMFCIIKFLIHLISYNGDKLLLTIKCLSYLSTIKAIGYIIIIKLSNAEIHNDINAINHVTSLPRLAILCTTRNVNVGM